MIFSIDVTVIFEKMLRLRLLNVDDFLNVKIVTKSLKLMKRCLAQEALSSFNDFNEITFVNDEKLNLKSKILEYK